MVWAYRPSNLKGEVSWFGRLNGVSGLRPVRTFELRPFAVARLTGGAGAGNGFFGGGVADGGERRELELRPDVGVDAKLGLTSRLMLDATVNPDFGQVEADQVELNLSRFETFFPEKRPFFLEGTDVYQTPVQLFYSRRIGKPLFGLATGDAADPGRRQRGHGRPYPGRTPHLGGEQADRGADREPVDRGAGGGGGRRAGDRAGPDRRRARA